MIMASDERRTIAFPAPLAAPAVDSERVVYERYLPLVRRMTMRLVRQLPQSIALDDLLSVGWVGLLEASRRRTSKMSEEEFEAFASHRIRGAILDYLRSLDPMSRRMRGASRQITHALQVLTHRLGRSPTEEETADELGLDLDAFRSLLGQVAQSEAARIELSDIGAQHAANEGAPEAIASRNELLTRIASAIDALPERLQLVMGLYYQEDCSLREIGEVLGVTESRVCQLHSEAIHRIRAMLEPSGSARGRAR